MLRAMPRIDDPTSSPVLFTRREAIGKLSAATLLALGLWPGRLRALGTTPPADEFTFIVVNDTHYKTPECGAWLQGVIERMRLERPAFCLLVGDIVDLASRETHAAMRTVLSTLDAPVYVQIGNHDYATQTDRTSYGSYGVTLIVPGYRPQFSGSVPLGQRILCRK